MNWPNAKEIDHSNGKAIDGAMTALPRVLLRRDKREYLRTKPRCEMVGK